MSDQDIAAKAVAAVGRAANEIAGDPTALVSISIDISRSAPVAAVEAHLTRKTRTLVFMTADVRGADGERLAIANSVHKVLTGGAP